MDILESLEQLSLVTKVTSELQNHLGLSDKTLAEFIIDQHTKSDSTQDFRKSLDAFGAEFPPSLVDSIDRLVRTMHPKYKAAQKQLETTTSEPRKSTAVFKGLAIPDAEIPAADEGDAMDDTFAALEGLAGKASRKRSASPTDRGRDRQSKRYKDSSYSRSRSRTVSPYKEKRRHRNGNDNGYVFEEDEYKRSRNGKNGHRKGRRRERSPSEDRLRKAPVPELDDTPELYKVYSGRVTGIKDYGAFVNLQGVRGKVDGLVHVSQFMDGRVNHPSDIVSASQEVKVKVIKTEGNKVSLSMKEVDQQTGRDMRPEKRLGTGANMQGLGRGAATGYADVEPGVRVVEDGYDPKRHERRKRLTTPERWEIKQLIASGAISRDQYPDIDEYDNHNVNAEGEIEEEEDVDIEVREEEPPFLAGQTKQSLELSPIRVVKAPDGSMNRAAIHQSELTKERRDLKDQETRDKAAQEANGVDVQSSWQDPMAEKKFASELRQARANAAREPPPEWKRIASGQEKQLGKRTSMSIAEQRKSLPVYKFRNQLIKAVQDHQILIVVGETGSGKTTQLTQFLAEAGFANTGIIGCTQPRRVAAMSVAQRVAEEVGCRLGTTVGFTIRFEDQTGPDTKIKYMTDGILQREILLDPMLSKYSAIMLDEAHERTIATDVLFALLKKTLKRRPDMKLIVTSATLDADKFSEYFYGCPIFSIPGRTYPVEILYSREPESDYLDSALTAVMQIHIAEPAGDILLFLTGKEEIDTSCEILHERMRALGSSVPELEILPIYGALPSEVASKIFEPAPPGGRKVVIATNIAETSITIDGIYYVVDPGFVKQNAYDPKLGMDRLQITPISQAQAKQRAGRAGRTGPGKCFRLYTESAFQSEMLPTTVRITPRSNKEKTNVTIGP
jgi:ATP-dependent RNA helicase DHX8/PRP22